MYFQYAIWCWFRRLLRRARAVQSSFRMAALLCVHVCAANWRRVQKPSDLVVTATVKYCSRMHDKARKPVICLVQSLATSGDLCWPRFSRLPFSKTGVGSNVSNPRVVVRTTSHSSRNGSTMPSAIRHGLHKRPQTTQLMPKCMQPRWTTRHGWSALG